jgi:surfeit locus 1 family protein
MTHEPSVARRHFRPTLWATLFAGLGVALLLGLGIWQLQRLEWKEGLIAERAQRPLLPPLTAEDLTAIDDAVPFEFRLARVTGEFMHDKEMRLVARSMNGNVGMQIVTPFVLDRGQTILVNRGWVPNELADPQLRPEGLVAGTATIDALVRRPGMQNWLVADNEPVANVWYWMDLAAMRDAAGVTPAGPPLYLEERAGQHPGEFPIGGQTRLELANDHLQYAVTWFLLAIALAVIWFLFHWQRDPKEGQGKP